MYLASHTTKEYALKRDAGCSILLRQRDDVRSVYLKEMSMWICFCLSARANDSSHQQHVHNKIKAVRRWPWLGLLRVADGLKHITEQHTHALHNTPDRVKEIRVIHPMFSYT